MQFKSPRGFSSQGLVFLTGKRKKNKEQLDMCFIENDHETIMSKGIKKALHMLCGISTRCAKRLEIFEKICYIILKLSLREV